MVNNLIRDILTTLAYSDIFDYPLTQEELWKFLLTKKRISKKAFQEALKGVSHIQKNGKTWYFLPKREYIVAKRLYKEKLSAEKLAKAEKVSSILSLIPTVVFIGISGSLAMLNADFDSDIDLFIITSPHTLWITRLLVWIVLKLLGMGRMKNDKHPKDTVCANMFVSSGHVLLPINIHDIFVAHEIAQVKPLFDRNTMYQKFLHANKWIQIYMPHTEELLSEVYFTHASSLWKLFIPVEFFARKAQVWYMHKARTTEITTKTMIAFHPINYKKITVDAFERRLKKYAL